MAIINLVYFPQFILLLLPLNLIDRSRKAAALWSRIYGRLIFGAFPFWRIKVEGFRDIDLSRPYVVMVNHQSFGDILVLFHSPLNIKWLSKSSVFKVPFIGWMMQIAGHVPIVRGDRDSAKQAMNKCAEWLERGSCVSIFPEGTRSKDGELLPFKDGGFRLALDAGVPILMMVIDGSQNMLPKGTWVIGEQSDVRFRCLGVQETDGFHGPDGITELMETVRKSMAEGLAELRGDRERG